MIGYMLQQALKNNLPQREVSVLLTQVEVDAADPAFSNPTKYIGPVYSEAQAKALAAEKGWVFKVDGAYFRRVVPSPQPKRIVESDAITALIQRDHRSSATAAAACRWWKTPTVIAALRR